MKPRELRSIHALDTLETVLSLPAPSDDVLQTWSASELRKSLEWARGAWLDLICTDLTLPQITSDEGEEGSAGATFSKLVRNVGVWFNALNDAHRACQSDKRYGVIFKLADSDRIWDAERPSDDHPYWLELTVARVALDAYIKTLICAALIPNLSDTPIRGTGAYAAFEAIAHGALTRLHDVQSTAPAPPLQALAGRLLHSLLHALKDGYEDVAGYRDQITWRPGPYSELQLEELSLLASRHESMARRFGAKRVEKRFEQQLSLLFQSLGWIVIQTRTGTRTVDLVCISSDPTSRLTFLVEAKTSKAAYAFPAKDERALRDYVADIDETLTTLPSLRFVLLVSHSATRTLASKLRAFETKSGKPIRFISAAALSQLRTDLPGPAPTGPFAELILDSSCVLPEEFVAQVVDRYRRQHDAHREFVEVLMAGGRSHTAIGG
jgi:hypothetical protein